MEQIEDALAAWVRSTTGLTAEGQVIFADQDGIRPGSAPPAEGPFCTIRIGDLTPISRHVVERNFDANRPGGQEVEIVVSIVNRFTPSVQFFSPTTTGEQSALALASRARVGMGLPSVHDALRAAGFSNFDPGAVRNLSRVLQTRNESRALLEPSFYVVERASEFIGYIAEVVVVDHLFARTLDITASGAGEEPLPPDYGPLAQALNLGPAAGVGATLDSFEAFDNAGRLTFTTGTFPSGPVADWLFEVLWSNTRTNFVASKAIDGNDAAAADDVGEQTFCPQESGPRGRWMLNALGPSLRPNTQYVLRYQVTG